MIEPEVSTIAKDMIEGFHNYEPLVGATLQSYVETTSSVGLVTADNSNLLFGGFSLFCSALPGTQFICVPMAVGFVYEWFDQTIAHMF